MKVTGFSFIRNACLYDYPIREAITSILPLCDEVVIAVGQSDDETLELVRSIAPDKIRIIETVWDDSLREGGRVLAVETEKAYAEVAADSDWAFYIQGDEVVHEDYHGAIREAMHRHKDDPSVDGLLFNYLHFYGSYDFIGDSANWYHREMRVIRKRKDIYSYNDAQGFRKGDNKKLKVVPIDAYVYHYGWVKAPEVMQDKQKTFNQLWHDDQWVEQHIPDVEAFDFESHIRSLKRFEGTHPAVMQERVNRMNWQFDYDISMNRASLKDRVKNFLMDKVGMDLGRKNYIIHRGK